MAQGYIYRNLDEVQGTQCPCGEAFRIVGAQDDTPVSFHVVKIKKDSERHYHRKMTEVYFCLEGEGQIELDRETLPLRPGIVVVIRPGTVHRAVGDLKIVNVVIPPFDPADEFAEGA